MAEQKKKENYRWVKVLAAEKGMRLIDIAGKMNISYNYLCQVLGGFAPSPKSFKERLLAALNGEVKS